MQSYYTIRRFVTWNPFLLKNYAVSARDPKKVYLIKKNYIFENV